MGVIKDYPLRSKPGEPVWELATLYPNQGGWSVASYLSLRSSRLIEYNHGTLEFPPMPTRSHQQIVWYLCQLLKAYLVPRGGDAWFAPIRVRVGPEKFREPDLVAFGSKHDSRAGNEFFDGADLVMEVVSEGLESHDRDYIEKRGEYEAAGIPEYWIVDPQERLIIVLKLKNGTYGEHTVTKDGQTAASAHFQGFRANVSAVFTQA